MAQRTEKNPPYGYKFNDKVVDDITELFQLSGGFLTAETQSLENVLNIGNNSGTNNIIMGTGTYIAAAEAGNSRLYLGLGAILQSDDGASINMSDTINLSNGTFAVKITTSNLTANRSIQFPNAGGTLALTSDIAANNELSEILANGNDTATHNIIMGTATLINGKGGSSIQMDYDDNGTAGIRMLGSAGYDIIIGENVKLVGDGCNLILSDTADITSGLYLGNGFDGSLNVRSNKTLNIGTSIDTGTVSIGNSTKPIVFNNDLKIGGSGGEKINGKNGNSGNNQLDFDWFGAGYIVLNNDNGSGAAEYIAISPAGNIQLYAGGGAVAIDMNSQADQDILGLFANNQINLETLNGTVSVTGDLKIASNKSISSSNGGSFISLDYSATPDRLYMGQTGSYVDLNNGTTTVVGTTEAVLRVNGSNRLNINSNGLSTISSTTFSVTGNLMMASNKSISSSNGGAQINLDYSATPDSILISTDNGGYSEAGIYISPSLGEYFDYTASSRMVISYDGLAVGAYGGNAGSNSAIIYGGGSAVIDTGVTNTIILGRGVTATQSNTTYVAGLDINGLTKFGASGITGEFNDIQTDSNITFNSSYPVLETYATSSVPNPVSAGAGALIFVSNESGGATIAFSDGAFWRRVQDRAIIS